MLHKKSINFFLWFIFLIVTGLSALPVVAQVMPKASDLTPEPSDLMRPGIGDWCYNPVAPLEETQKRDYVDFAITQAQRAQQDYGIPGALLAAMSIRESGYGRTRLAILSNNILSFKKPNNEKWRFGRPTFVLWCQPPNDVGNEYLIFGSKDAAFDYVAKVLAQRNDLEYAKITKIYHNEIAASADEKARKDAAIKWLKEIAKIYTGDKNYVDAVLSFADNPINPGSASPKGQSLWELVPPK